MKDRGPRVNHQIRVPEVRLIGSDGSQIGVIATFEARRRAEEEGLDLVEISAGSKPPVCKIMDHGKYKYEQAKKRQEAKKHQVVIHIKEIKLRPTTDQHDLDTKLRHIRRFLEEGNKVKLTLRFRGRELAHRDLGMGKLKGVLESLADVSKIDQEPKFENKTFFAVIAPLGKASKKAGGKNAKVEVKPGSEKTL